MSVECQDKSCCELQTEVLDLAAELSCEGQLPEVANNISAAALLMLICRSFVVYDAWTPKIAVEQQGTEIAFKITDWFGGSGTKPETGFLDEDGNIVATWADAYKVNLSITTAGQNVYIGDYEATEDISSLRLVNIHGDDQIRLADSVLGREAHGIIASTTLTGNTVSVFSMGVFSGFSGLTGGVARFLGQSGVTAAAIPGGSTISQKVGVAKNTTTFVLDIEEVVSI